MSLPFYVGLTLDRRKNSFQGWGKISFQNCFVKKCFPWIVWFLFSIFPLLSSILIRSSYWDHLRDEDIFDALKKAAKKAGLSPVEKYLFSLLLKSKFLSYIRKVLSLSEASSKVNLRYPQIITPLNSEIILDSL
jgi:hypothetical protein